MRFHFYLHILWDVSMFKVAYTKKYINPIKNVSEKHVCSPMLIYVSYFQKRKTVLLLNEKHRKW